jgi:hypothetical protein
MILVRRSSYFCYCTTPIVLAAGEPMQENRITAAAVEAAKRKAVRRRAKRGLVAGYIHEISGRHAAAAVRPQPPAQPAAEPARGT